MEKFCREEEVDIFLVTESWLSPSINSGAVSIGGYTLFRNDFISPFPKYGVCAYIKDSISACQCADQDLPPNTLMIHLQPYNVYVLLVYRPPSYSVAENLRLP